ncbi:rhomboid family intramembrane serine protease [Bdellovibrio reynosensis]|uniref:Rhomboid family intramembrane serine protease n=1 Tax=Bdellovibrio reynosensis TaxID=2835041 RepID=A0ABY4CE83_9BACT|nr:rhomboid family intramembrane serine protease [Bdellovibrio reynosensis]UOF02774.1 rhomboid family intramembrane serine protease [Bdellovibrio reynosensis]
MNRGGVTFQTAPMTPAVKWLLIINVAVWFVIQVIVEGFLKIPFTSIFGLYPGKVLFDFNIWQIFTYMFLHSMQVTHILFNMLMLWFFGAELEQRWGTRFFLIYYFVSGVGAAILYCLGVWGWALATGSQTGLIVPVIGASGAIFGLLLAQGILFGERIVYFFMLFPMKTRYFVALMGLVQLASMMTSSVSGGEVAYLAHLGGLVSGYICLKSKSWIDRNNQNRRTKSKGRNLRLVVDNEKSSKDKPPKYWN